MPLSTVESCVATYCANRETPRFPRVSCLKSLLIRPVPLYFRPNDGLVTLQRQLAFWIDLLLIGNARPGELKPLLRSRTAHDIAGIVVLLCFSDACWDLFQ